MAAVQMPGRQLHDAGGSVGLPCTQACGIPEDSSLQWLSCPLLLCAQMHEFIALTGAERA
jgi:hypothetical protein